MIDITNDLQRPLVRTLRGLSDMHLAALIVGLECHGDDLAPGRLYRSSSGGGCAVGVMVRELRPQEFDGSRLRFWLWHGWRRRARSYGGALAASPRVGHLESLFDRSVKTLQDGDPALTPAQAASLVGRWLAAQAEAELGRRHDTTSALVAPNRLGHAHAVC
jgi:hypothetical protein